MTGERLGIGGHGRGPEKVKTSPVSVRIHDMHDLARSYTDKPHVQTHTPKAHTLCTHKAHIRTPRHTAMARSPLGKKARRRRSKERASSHPAGQDRSAWVSRPEMNLVRVLGSPRVRDPSAFPSELSERQHDLSGGHVRM